MEYLVFGSQDSVDTDVMLITDSIGTIQECRDIVSNWKQENQFSFDKKLNCNLCIIKNGIVIDVFKGTPDEVNNSIYYTFDLHVENLLKKCPIKRKVNRNVELKILRSVRIILGFLSRTEKRTEIKSALRGTIFQKISLLKKIDLIPINTFNKKNKV